MERWARIVDHLLGEAIGDGDISDLPGAGQPLASNEDSHTPPHQRAAFKIMQDNEVAPAWMALAKSVEQGEAQIRAEVASNAAQLEAAISSGANAPERSRALTQLEERIERHNREVLLHNLTVPRGIPHRPTLNSRALLKQARAQAKLKT